jgi:putative colanic acid biosysnthesis UDP-glucose lipid carrier transferase
MPRSLLKTHATLLEQLLRLADPLWLAAAGIAAHAAYFGSPIMPDNYVFAVLLGAALGLGVMPLAGLYRPQRGMSLIVELGALFNAWLVFAGCGVAFLFATKTGIAYSRVWAGLWVVFGITGHAGLRIALRIVLRYLRRRGYNLRHIAVVGGGPFGINVATRLMDTPWAGFAIRGVYDDEPAGAAARPAQEPLRRPLAQLALDLQAGTIDQVWIALPLRAEERIRVLLTELRDYPVQICFVPDIYNFNLLHHSFSEIAGLPVINLTDTPMEGGKRLVKAIEDYVFSAMILLIASPLLLLIALGIKLTSPGPVFYRQERVTWNGAYFAMLKFRSMPVRAEAASGPVWAQPGEARATRFGAFLRRASLDELPQFINVLKGEMSIVGPRPERPQFVDEFRKQIPGYMQKHLVKAGITGWAQVNDLRGNTDVATRIQYDLYYIENWSIWLDLRIMALTVVNIFTSRNAY